MSLKRFTKSEYLHYFGDFSNYLTAEGIPDFRWENEILTWVQLPTALPLAWNHSKQVTSIRCHKLIAESLNDALYEIYNHKPGLWETIDDYGGCYQFRLTRNSTNILSAHCWAIAIDLDVADNPYGENPQVDPDIVSIFDKHGYIWGGYFKGKRKDGMHFEFADRSKLTT